MNAIESFKAILDKSEAFYQLVAISKDGQALKFQSSFGTEKVYQVSTVTRAIKEGTATYDNGRLQWKLKKYDISKAEF